VGIGREPSPFRHRYPTVKRHRQLALLWLDTDDVPNRLVLIAPRDVYDNIASWKPALTRPVDVRVGDSADIQRVYRELEAALSEGMDAEPTEETAELHKKLIEQLEHGSNA
jgi:hypothetical protein